MAESQISYFQDNREESLVSSKANTPLNVSGFPNAKVNISYVLENIENIE